MKTALHLFPVLLLASLTPLHAQDPTPEQAVEFIEAAFSCPNKPQEILSIDYSILNSDSYVGDKNTLKINASYTAIHGPGSEHQDAIYRNYYEARFSDIEEVYGFEFDTGAVGIAFTCKQEKDCFTNDGGKWSDSRASFQLCDASVRDDAIIAFRALLNLAKSQ